MPSHKNVILGWIPSYIRVSGNERAHWAAKSALDLSPEVISIPYTDLKPIISKFLHTKWQQRWDNNIHNKLFQIQPTLGGQRTALRKSRREQVVISWLRIGHTRLTHFFILKEVPQPQCLTCQTTCTIKHILIECRAIFQSEYFNQSVRKRQNRWRSVLLERDRVVPIISPIKTGWSCANKWNPANRKFYLRSICLEIFGWMYIHINIIWRSITYKGWYAIKPKQPAYLQQNK